MFVLSATDLRTQQGRALLEQIEGLAESSPNNNIVVIASSQESLDAAPGSPGLEWFYRNRRGVIEGRVSLFHAEAKMLMLDDERVIAFDSCSVASDVECVQDE